MRPGMTIRSVASIAAADAALRFGPTAAIFLPSISTSAFSKSPTLGSMLSTMPPFSRTRRPLLPLPGGMFWAKSVPGSLVPVAIAPARKRRRDIDFCSVMAILDCVQNKTSPDGWVYTKLCWGGKMEIRVNARLGAFFFFFSVAGASAASLFIQGGTLIDGTGKPPIANANVLIVDNTISRVWSGAADQNIPPGTQVLDARGKFVIPGLIDSHTHYNWYMGELSLAHGVTTVYDMGNPLDWQNAVRKGLNSGKLRGPLYYH